MKKATFNLSSSGILSLLVVSMCVLGASGGALRFQKGTGQQDTGVQANLNRDANVADTPSRNTDGVVRGVVTLLAELKRTNALATCGVRPKHQMDKLDTQFTRSMRSLGANDFVRVVAGVESPTRWPWQVALVNKTTKEPYCGGTLIDREHILTAAHCFDGKNQNDVVIVLGEHDRSKNEGTEQEFPVGCVHIHRRYVTGVPYNNDIAVVKLKTSPDRGVIINDYVTPACMPEKNEFRAGDICYVTGWGYTNFFDFLVDKRPSVLNEAKLPILSNTQCQQAYGSYISKKMICAGHLEGEYRADTCKGDSGGPLVCQRDGVWKVFGVTSWGDNSFCNPSPTDAAPGVYTRVDRYRSWIKSRIEMTSCPSRR